MKLSIIIPAWNEEFRLPPTLSAYGTYFGDKYGEDLEIIVVANHCSDGTVRVAREIAGLHPQIQVIEDPSCIGKGGAVELGMRHAQGDLVGFVDADGATAPDAFFKLVENMHGAGCIIGSRWIEGAVVSPRQPLMRRLASRLLNKVFVQGLFGLELSDSQCGAKLFRRDVLEQVLPEAIEQGWAFDIDLLCRVKRLGYDIRELPTEWHHVAGNTTTFMVMSLQMLASVFRVKRALARS
jgi:glycosyltransferase involved in cell wall biosynthesis